MISRTIRTLVLVALSVLAGCTDRRADRESVPPSPMKCRAFAVAPSRFSQTETVEERYPDHIGVRVTFADDRGRLLHSFTGVPGEFGEGLPVAGSVHLVSGQDVSLIGKGRTWIIAWDTEGLCGAHALIGNGFTKEAFIKALNVFGVI